MSTFRLARTVGLSLAFVVLGVSGAYVVIDLARWEWNRAIISALIFLSALVVIVGMMLFRQLQEIDARMEAMERVRLDHSAELGTLRTMNRAAASRRFRWLEDSPSRVGVFVPVLLGAGVVLSFVAYLIERVAGAFAASTLDRRTVRHLAIDLPLGAGIVQPNRHAAVPAHRPAMRIAAALLAIVLAVVLVQGIRELTQTRPGEVTAPGSTTIVLDIGQIRQIRALPVVAEDLWSSCRSRLPGPIELVAITPQGGQLVRLDLDRALGHTGRARIIGCFQDYTLDLVRADVVSLETRST